MNTLKRLDDILKNKPIVRTDIDTVWELSWRMLEVYKALSFIKEAEYSIRDLLVYSKLIIIDDNEEQEEIYTDYVRDTFIPVNANSHTFVIKVPATYTAPTILLNGMEIPMIEQDNETIEGVEYKVYRSDSAYLGSFKIQVV